MEHRHERNDRRDRDYDQEGGNRRRAPMRRKVCRFCTDKEVVADYKNPKLLSYFVTDRGRIIPRRVSGACAMHQRDLTTQIKRARSMALLPFTSTQN